LFKPIAALLLLSLSGCGFQPMYAGQGTDSSLDGASVRSEQAAIFIDEIPNREGQLLRRALLNRLTPAGEPVNPHYRLSVVLSNAAISEQGVRKDNLATRYEMSYTSKYTLTSYPDGKTLLNGSTSARASYDVQKSPYASHAAEEAMKERVMRILGDDIALRLAAYLKSAKK